MNQLYPFNRCNPLQYSALSCRAEPATSLYRKCCLIKSLRPLRPLRAERKHPCGDYISHAKSAEDAKFYFHTVHADAGVVVSFTATGERREGRNIWHCLCYKRIFYIFVRTINDNVV